MGKTRRNKEPKKGWNKQKRQEASEEKKKQNRRLRRTNKHSQE